MGPPTKIPIALIRSDECTVTFTFASGNQQFEDEDRGTDQARYEG